MQPHRGSARCDAAGVPWIARLVLAVDQAPVGRCDAMFFRQRQNLDDRAAICAPCIRSKSADSRLQPQNVMLEVFRPLVVVERDLTHPPACAEWCLRRARGNRHDPSTSHWSGCTGACAPSETGNSAATRRFCPRIGLHGAVLGSLSGSFHVPPRMRPSLATRRQPLRHRGAGIRASRAPGRTGFAPSRSCGYPESADAGARDAARGPSTNRTTRTMA